ncbi:MAG: SDR family oxidoreductase [Actinomycetota bacterium]|nr:SDR family oxidoreductase [Actinomycetota bacterium]
MDLGLDGKACVVTGASRGIGLASAAGLAAEGARVLLVGRDADRLERAAGELPGAATAALDVTAPDAGERVVAACEAAFGGIDALVNNAGTSQARALEDLDDEEWQRQWDLHVMAPMRLMRAAAPRMAERGGGRIVNVSSSAGKRPSGTLDAPYSVTKAAELSLSRVFADQWAARGVLVNAVTPGPVEGELWLERGGLADQVAARQGSDRDAVLESVRRRTPRGRMGTEDEIAAVVVFLCSARASNVVGAAWSVDGGSVPTIL